MRAARLWLPVLCVAGEFGWGMDEARWLFVLVSLRAGSAVMCAFIVPDGLSRVLSTPHLLRPFHISLVSVFW